MDNNKKRPTLRYVQENDISDDRQATYLEDDNRGYRKTANNDSRYKQVNTDG